MNHPQHFNIYDDELRFKKTMRMVNKAINILLSNLDRFEEDKEQTLAIGMNLHCLAITVATFVHSTYQQKEHQLDVLDAFFDVTIESLKNIERLEETNKDQVA